MNGILKLIRVTAGVTALCCCYGCAALNPTVSSVPAGAEIRDEWGKAVGSTPTRLGPIHRTMRYEVVLPGYVTKPLLVSISSPSFIEVTLEKDEVDEEPVKEITATTLMEVVSGDKGLEIKTSSVFSEKDVIERSPNVRAVRRLTNLSNIRQVGAFRLFPFTNNILMEILDQEILDIGGKAQYSNLWSIDAARGGALQRLTEGKYFDGGPCFSPDGKFVYFSSNRAGRNSIFRLSIGGSKGLGMITSGATSDSLPQLSPDGETLMYTANMEGTKIPQLWSMPIERGLPMQLREGYGAQWSPDGKTILYSGIDRNINKVKIWTMTPDGSEPVQLTQSSECNDIDPVWSPDGKQIVFASDRGISNGQQNYDIWIMNADGSNTKQLTTNGSRDDHPIISADGKTVYFRSNRGLKWDIWVLEIADGGKGK